MCKYCESRFSSGLVLGTFSVDPVKYMYRPIQAIALVPICSHSRYIDWVGIENYFIVWRFFTLDPLKRISRHFQTMAIVLTCSHDFSQFIDRVAIEI